ncbi:hypothetical protein SNOG_08905 [Parastagonospora nodorum SN15]|uniref:Uncharacterized protein n=1 Tax=Phaeosphaeria nodorum (strain SN15 / ATCC MYA-4574 / FGSC 10173) TaxID=321614 RepID=Q0UH59_PHANO|nr:hypothetical protein SNOG_08905 [Parastagonospora nodorum SN15]EAT84073.1 hypothetical protein SNOG_08905 [Parastagonospora nodorum SN15]
MSTETSINDLSQHAHNDVSPMLKPKLLKPHLRPSKPTWWKTLLGSPYWSKSRPRQGRPTWWEVQEALVAARARLDGLVDEVRERVVEEGDGRRGLVWEMAR